MRLSREVSTAASSSPRPSSGRIPQRYKWTGVQKEAIGRGELIFFSLRFAFADSDLLFSGFDGLTHASGRYSGEETQTGQLPVSSYTTTMAEGEKMGTACQWLRRYRIRSIELWCNFIRAVIFFSLANWLAWSGEII